MTQQAIAQQIGISIQTVQRWLAAGTFPQSTRHQYVSQLDPHLPYLIQRWAQGCHNMAQLFQELVAQGYQGSYASVRDNIVRRLPFDGRKTPAGTSSKVSLLPSPRQAAFLFLRPPEKLRVQEQETLVKLCQVDSEVALAYDLVQQFAHMLRGRSGEHLDEWLAQAQSSNLPELQSFAAGVEKDKDAVRAGLNGRDQQWRGRRTRDEAEIDQKTRLWQSRISPSPKTGSSCRVMPTPSSQEELSGKNREPDEHMLSKYPVPAVFAASCIVTRQT